MNRVVIGVCAAHFFAASAFSAGAEVSSYVMHPADVTGPKAFPFQGVIPAGLAVTLAPNISAALAKALTKRPIDLESATFLEMSGNKIMVIPAVRQGSAEGSMTVTYVQVPKTTRGGSYQVDRITVKGKAIKQLISMLAESQHQEIFQRLARQKPGVAVTRLKKPGPAGKKPLKTEIPAPRKKEAPTAKDEKVESDQFDPLDPLQQMVYLLDHFAHGLSQEADHAQGEGEGAVKSAGAAAADAMADVGSGVLALLHGLEGDLLSSMGEDAPASQARTGANAVAAQYTGAVPPYSTEKIKLEIASDGVSLDGQRGVPTQRTVKGYDSRGKILFGGLTLYTKAFGHQETFAGNGLEDGELLIAVRLKDLESSASSMRVDFVSTGEEGELNVEPYVFRRAAK